MMDDEDFRSQLAGERKRPHAAHFSWESDRSVAEWCVLREFVIALQKTGQEFFEHPRHRGTGNDPPDCEAVSESGQRIAIEITELVDPKSAAAARVGADYDEKDWNGALVPALARIIARKDNPSAVKDAPYSGYVLLIHTDEPWLNIDYARRILAEYVFPKTSLITRAYLLVSYDPFEQGYPLIRLRINGT